MFIVFFTVYSAWVVMQIFDEKKGPRVAMWNGWLLAMLMLPVWLVKGLGSVTLDFRTGGAVWGIGGFLLNDKEKLYYKFAIMDALIFSLFLTHLISGFGAKEMSLMTIPEIGRRWLLPYIVGRVFISKTSDLKRFLPVVAVILLILSASNALEAGSKVNILCKALGKSYPILEAGEGYRWGMKRAQGPLDHPIFNGLMLVMTYPFAVEAGRRAFLKQGPRWWKILPFITFGAVVCTASRGPIIAALTAVFCTVTFSSKFRVPLLIGAIMMGVVAVEVKDQLKEALASMAEDEEFVRYVEIEGKEYRYTGTAHRELLFLVYKKAIRECPLFGYGNRMRGVPIAEHLTQRFSSIDNHYLLFYLRRGKMGLGLFISITAVALYYLLRMAWNQDLPQSAMAGAMVGSLLGVSSLLTSVWFAPDHGAVWLFFVGLTTCMWTVPNDGTGELEEEPAEDAVGETPSQLSVVGVSEVREVVPAVAPRRRFPGHAPRR